MSATTGWLRAGVVGRPHGLDGSFHVGRPIAGLLTAGAAVRVAGVDRRIARRAGFDARPILRLEGDEDRADAEALRGQELLVARERAPELGPDEWWADDLEGCAVSGSGRQVGVVTRLLELPSCQVLEVARTGGGDALLVPLIGDAVRDVDLERKVIEIDLHFLGED
ncbi:MAG TPA: ribosome maturation factor RimM [Solirubrobacteraceae bacterium]